MKIYFPLLTAACVVACADVTPTDLTHPVREFTQLDASAYELVDLGTFGVSNQAFGINDNGDVYGRYNSGTFNGSFRWTEHDGFEDLGGIDNRPFQFLRTNKHGLLTGWVPSDFGSAPRAVVYLPHGGFTYVDDAAHGGQAWGVNKYGTVVGQRFPFPNGPNEPFMWSEANGLTIIPVTYPAGQPRGAQVTAITDDSAVLGALNVLTGPPNSLQTYAFIWDAQNGTQLLPKFTSAGIQVGATDLNADRVAVGAAETRLPRPGERRTIPLSFTPGDVPIHAWRWSAARGLEDLGTLGGKHSVAWAVDEDGNAYGWAMDAAGVQHAVKWPVDGPVIRLPDLGGPTQTGAVNKHGVLVAQSATPSGQTHAVIYVPQHALSYSNGPDDPVNILRGDSVLLVSIIDKESDLRVIEGLPEPVSASKTCGGNLDFETIPLQEVGVISGVIKALAQDQDASYHVYKASTFHGYCHTTPIAYGRGKFTYHDNDAYQTSDHVNVWGFQVQAGVVMPGTLEQKSLFAIAHASMNGPNGTSLSSRVDLK